MRSAFTGDALALILCAGILVCWAPGYWAVALVEVPVFLLATIWLIRVALARVPVESAGILIAVAGLAVWGALQLAAGQSVYPFETVKALLYWFANAAVFALAFHVSIETGSRNRLLRALLWFSFVLSLITVVQYFTSGGKVFWLFPTEYQRALGPFIYKNQCAAFIELAFPVALYQSLVDRRHSWLYTAMAATMFATAIAAVSRAGAVLVMAELMAILVLACARKLISLRTFSLALGRMAAVCMVVTLIVGWQVTWEKFRQPEPFHIRQELFLSSMAMIAERPWTGFGLGSWPTVYPAYARFDNGQIANRAHNDWAEWAAEGGLLFFAILVSIAVWSIPRSIASLWGIGVIAVFAHCALDYPLREPALAALFFAILGAVGGRAREIRDSSSF